MRLVVRCRDAQRQCARQLVCRATKCSKNSKPVAANRASAQRWVSQDCCATWHATKILVSVLCRLFRMKRELLVWTHCFANSRFMHHKAKNTSRSTTTCCSNMPRPATVKFLKKASPKPAVLQVSSPRARVMQLEVCRWCRFTPSIQCSAFSVSET